MFLLTLIFISEYIYLKSPLAIKQNDVLRLVIIYSLGWHNPHKKVGQPLSHQDDKFFLY